MIREEYDKLVGLIEKSANLEVPMEEILKESVVFFEMLRAEFPKASKEEREEMIHMMTSLHSKLQEVAETSAKSAGMSEEELTTYAEDPSNFTPEQWRLVQTTRRQLYDSARKFSSTMEKQKRPGEGEKAPPKRKTVKAKTRRSKRSDWTKS